MWWQAVKISAPPTECRPIDRRKHQRGQRRQPIKRVTHHGDHRGGPGGVEEVCPDGAQVTAGTERQAARPVEEDGRRRRSLEFCHRGPKSKHHPHGYCVPAPRVVDEELSQGAGAGQADLAAPLGERAQRDGGVVGVGQ